MSADIQFRIGNAFQEAAPAVHHAQAEFSEHSVSRSGLLQKHQVASLSPSAKAALEQLAFQYGESPDSYLAVEPHRKCFLSSDHSAAVSVIESGRYLHISGGILAPPDSRSRIIAQLTEYAKHSRCLIACYSIGERDRLLFEEAGWEVTKFGEETTLKLASLQWTGKPYEWVRRQSNYCRRMGLIAKEVNRPTMSEASWTQMATELFEIQKDDLQHRFYSQELNLLVGKLQPDQLGRRRLFVAENTTTGQIEAFIVANPMRGGKAWAFEMFRKRQHATRGAIPFLIKSITELLRAEGVEEVSLCILLWKDILNFKGKRTSQLVRWALVFGYHVGNSIYRTKGLSHFKTRFRPDLSNSYLCVTPRSTVFSTISFLCVVGALSFNARNAARMVWNSLFRRTPRDN
jgi:phosphatidylglycerol lysyltransferase